MEPNRRGDSYTQRTTDRQSKPNPIQLPSQHNAPPAIDPPYPKGFPLESLGARDPYPSALFRFLVIQNRDTRRAMKPYTSIR